MKVSHKDSRNDLPRQARLGVIQTLKELGCIHFQKRPLLEMLRDARSYWMPQVICLVNALFLFVRYLLALAFLERTVITTNPIYLVLSCGLPFLFLLGATACEEASFGKRRTAALWFCISNAHLTLLQCAHRALYDFIVTKVMYLPSGEYLTKGMIVGLARGVLVIPEVLLSLLVLMPVARVLSGNQFQEWFLRFRIDRVIDLRPERKSAYDASFMRDAREGGASLPIYEEDLFTHMLLLGPSGTGKTSSVIMPMAIGFLKRKLENEKKREQVFRRLLSEGKGYVRGPLNNPTEYDIVPHPGHEEEFKAVRHAYPDAGLTFVSPNEAIGDGIIGICERAGIAVNIIDPTKTYEEKNANSIGLNPFYVPARLTDEERAVQIVNQAKVFSETLLTVNEANGEGGGEKYFKDLNTSVTNHVAILCMLYANLEGRQTNWAEVMDCISDFKLLYPKVIRINDYFHFGFKIADPATASAGKKKGGGEFSATGLARSVMGENPGAETEEASYRLLSSGDPSDENAETFKRSVRYANNELFQRGETLYDQSRGLRNIIEDVVAHPRIFKILNATENFLDFDRILSRCEVTVINTGIRIGPSASTGLGLFFLLNHKRAVLRRPADDRQDHFLTVDEATQYVHSWMEDAISLYRQYRCSVTFAFQSLAQLNKTNQTRYVQGLLLTVGEIIVFGRIGEGEMKVFEKMGGSSRIVQMTEQESQTSILSETPTETFGRRNQETEEASASATDLRIRGFQEATWIGTVKGDVQFARIVRVSFPNKDPFRKVKIAERKWDEWQAKDKGVWPGAGRKTKELGSAPVKEDIDDEALFALKKCLEPPQEGEAEEAAKTEVEGFSASATGFEMETKGRMAEDVHSGKARKGVTDDDGIFF